MGLIAYGVAGVLLMAIALAVGLDATGRVERLSDSLSSALDAAAARTA